MAKDEAPLGGVLDDLESSGREEAVSVGEILEAFQHRSLGALLTLLGLIAAIPVFGAIPGVTVLLALLILLVVGQNFLGGGAIWLPDFLARREISRDLLEKGIGKARPWLDRIDNALKPRLALLSEGRLSRWIIALAAALLALAFFPLAIVPYGVLAPALGVMALGLGLMARDGLLILFGYALAGVTAYLLVTWL